MTINLTKIELTFIIGIVLVLLVNVTLDGYYYAMCLLAIGFAVALYVAGELRRRREKELEDQRKAKAKEAAEEAKL